MRRGILGILCMAALGCLATGTVDLLHRRNAWNPRPAAATAPAAASAALQPPASAATGPPAPSFDVVKVGPGGTAVIAGRAEPGARVTVLDGDKPIGEVTADRRGEWVLVPNEPMPPGDRQLSLEAKGPGGETAHSSETVALSVTPPAANGEAALAVVLPQDTAQPVKVLQRPDGTAAPLSLDAVEYGEGRLLLSGHAAPGATVRIYLGDRPLGTATADADGSWAASAPLAAASGGREVRLDELAADGTVAHRVTAALAEAAAAELVPGHAYIVRPGNNLWQIARRSYGSGARYLIIYSANLGKIRDPDLIYPGQVFVLPKS